MNNLLWGLLACLSWGVCPILDRLGLLKISPSIVIFIQSLTITILTGAYLLFNFSVKGISSELSNSNLQILFLVIAAIVGGILGEYAYLKSITKGNLSASVAISSCYPLVTALTAYIFIAEGITLQSLIGIILIISGIVLLS